ncbi:hypothetical protein AWJ20_4862 [Sugiyamaella lignohabitans]|uniref:Uncharacterized protein n=1 Tax=Sugiyamaella lignohabitans TaxID=796027 RepID=A0A167ECP2_9ASCO|nr:uncharacterized protein AWJ20_4862 [Sugiyamaella lignohabitans]ANB13911.1 hypothetical protein AWJ20_4862 [Sugiyamaella lignohabitans]
MATSTRYRRQAPTSSEIISSTTISNSEAEEVLTQYLDSITTKDSVSHQLTRLQRSLRGLPSLLQDPEEFVDGEDQADVNMDINMDADALPNGTVKPASDGKISKEQRKKLKKERRKQEKKERASKPKADENDDMSE